MQFSHFSLGGKSSHILRLSKNTNTCMKKDSGSEMYSIKNVFVINEIMHLLKIVQQWQSHLE